MPLESGRKLGPYEIVEPIGKGGMGEVYRARDTKLDREVAIKVLPEEFAEDDERLARFEREAKLLASLNHPNIASIYGFEEADDVNALVLELVEGPTLEERIQQGPIPLDEALEIGTQIAEAVEVAHALGIIHRDLKPANIKITPEGVVKVLDFGLAKAFTYDESSGSAVSQSPTLTKGTAIGAIMGTAAYMSPEQAKGRPVDTRTDVWAYGAVLYEMLAGERAFKGEDVSDTLVAVFRDEPDWTKLPSDIPPRIPQAMKVCLRKDANQRVRDIAAVRLALDGAFETMGSTSPDGVAASQPPDRGTWNRASLAFASLFLVAAGVAGWLFLRPDPTRPVSRFEAPFREGQAPIGPMELTRDGLAVVYVGPGESAGGSQLWIRSWDELDARPIPGTEGARQGLSGGKLALSPDGSEVAFVVGRPGPLRTAPLAGGVGRTLAESAFNASWSNDEWVYFTSGDGGGIRRVRSTGGETEIVSEPSEGEAYHMFPQPLPDGKTLLFQANYGGGSDDEVRSIDLETHEQNRLTLGNNPRYTASGHLLFGALGSTLLAAPFDAQNLTLTGATIPVAEGLFISSTGENAVYTVSEDGTLLYKAGKTWAGAFEFVWVTRTGDVTRVDAGETFSPVARDYQGWRLSPDGRRIAFGRRMDANDDVWIKELPDSPMSRLTFNEGVDGLPQWTPDGQSITYRNHMMSIGGGSLWSRRADGTGEREIVSDELSVKKGVWSPDGEWLVVRTAEPSGESRDILAIRPSVDRAPVPLVATEEFWEQAPAISRDGRWLAYSSNETGRNEIFVRPFPDVDAGKWQISTGGGIQPVWAHNGRELFFANPETRELNAAAFTTTSTTFQRDRVTTLFVVAEDMIFNETRSGSIEFYDVAADDQRFLMAQRSGTDDDSTTFVLVLNFFEELKRLVPN